MAVRNADIANAFNRIADLLEIEGANPFRIRAYRNAARTATNLAGNFADMVHEGRDLSKLPTIGEDLAHKIVEMVETGHIALLDEILARTPGELADLMGIPGLGPKRVKTLYEKLDIASPAALARAAKAGKLRDLPGFGAKFEAKLLRELGRWQGLEKRFKLVDAEEIAAPLFAYLEGLPEVERAIIAGSFRRRKETVGDLDILATATDGAKVMDRFVAYDEVDRVVSKGRTRSTVILASGLQVDLRVVPEQSYGAALHYFTGSKAHNIAVRVMGVDRGLKINEYGVFKGDKRLAGRTEKEVYAKVDLPYIEPELRENRGEIEAAQQGRLPKLVTLDDIRGDLHCHTVHSDGRATVKEMAAAARAKGYRYLAICDHTQHATIAKGLKPDALAKELDEIDRVNAAQREVTLLKSAEVDILDDGALDLPEKLLERLDFTVCAVHYKFDLPEDEQTRRVLTAMDNPYFTILAHPTGRLIGERPAYDIDLERIIKKARDRGCFIELNAHPLRLDLDDVHCKLAKDLDVKVALATDAHSVDGLNMMRFGVDQARRGWLEAADVLNTRNLKDLKSAFRACRRAGGAER